LIVVDFEPRPDVIADFKSTGLIHEPSGLLEAYYLRMPATFRVDELELIPKGESYNMPLLFLARIMTDEIRELRDGGRTVVRFPMGVGGIVFNRHHDRVSLGPVDSSDRVETGYEALVGAWENCSSRIREYLLAELPELAENPDFAAWFRGEEE